MTRGFWALVALSLTACQEAAPDINQQAELGKDMVVSCGAESLKGLIGQPKTVLETMRFSQRIRVISPGSAVTKDYLPTRLNIYVDGKGMIIDLRCG
ncbi:MAG: I78 family peptidase inhibitor [Cypionkella sp.]|nr:I78 family peptidase inhibitor [Cypionkella sp.]